MMACQDCGGTGVDVGSLYEPEQCVMCHGTGQDPECEEPTPVRKPILRVSRRAADKEAYGD